MKKRLRYWFFLRRKRKLEHLARMLGHDFAVEYGARRGWVESTDGRRIFLAHRYGGRW